MSHLRFTPAEYATLCSLCLELVDKNVPSFQRLLVAALAGIDPHLANRIAGLGREKIGLLYFHFRLQPPVCKGHNLTPGELQTLELMFQGVASPVRFIKFYKESVVKVLRKMLPKLAAKVARLSMGQFEELYHQAVCRRAED